MSDLLISGAVIAALCGDPNYAFAQSLGAVRGVVTSNLTATPIAGVLVTDSARRLSSRTNTAGEFQLTRNADSRMVVTLQAVGYTAKTVVITFRADTVLERIELDPISQQLNSVPVVAAAPVSPRLSEFEERRRFGQGRFLTDSVFEKHRNRPLSEIMAMLPGLRVARGMGNAGWISGTRGSGSTRNSGFTPSDMDARRGAPKACYAAIMLDGGYVFSGKSGELLFDVNSIPASQVAGVEYYAGASSTPLKFRGADTGCGLLLIWTK